MKRHLENIDEYFTSNALSALYDSDRSRPLRYDWEQGKKRLKSALLTADLNKHSPFPGAIQLKK